VRLKLLGVGVAMSEVGAFRGAAAIDNAADCTSNAVPLLVLVLLLGIDLGGCTSIVFVKEMFFPMFATCARLFAAERRPSPPTRAAANAAT
jgi:hypothetical protein